jgi:hypothetical protein
VHHFLHRTTGCKVEKRMRCTNYNPV